MILDAVLRKTALFEAEQLAVDLRQLGHRVSRATVYRTLAHLQDAGILKQVFFDNKQSYYDVIVGRQAYDYLICVTTGNVIEFSSDKLRKLRDEVCRQHGFEPLSHQFHIFGLSPQAKAEVAAGGAKAAGARENPRSTHRDERRQRENADPDLFVPESTIGKLSQHRRGLLALGYYQVTCRNGHFAAGVRQGWVWRAIAKAVYAV